MIKSKTPKKSKLEEALSSYKKINDKTIYKRMKAGTKITKDLKEEIGLIKKSGKSVVLISGSKQISHLAPGQDPYQIRKDTDKVLLKVQASNPEKKAYKPVAKNIIKNVTKISKTSTISKKTHNSSKKLPKAKSNGIIKI